MSNKKGYKRTVTLRKKTLKSGKISLYLDIYLGNKKRQYEFLGITYHPKNISDKKQKLVMAQEIAVRREYELLASDNGIIPHYKKRSNFVEYFEGLAYSKPKSEKAWRNTYKHLENFTRGHIAFNSIDEAFLEGFKSFLLSKVSTNTAHTYFSKIKASLNHAVRDKILTKNISNNIKHIPKNDTQRSYLSLEELHKLSKTPCDKDVVKLAFLFSCNTGLRLSDVKRLTWSDVLLNENKIIITQQKTKESLYLPINKTALSILSKLKSNKIINMSNKIFLLPSDTLINKVVKSWVSSAGIHKKVTFHTSRHTFATISLITGTDLYTVSKLLGHKNIQNTQIYAKVVDESMRRAVNNIPDIEVI